MRALKTKKNVASYSWKNAAKQAKKLKIKLNKKKITGSHLTLWYYRANISPFTRQRVWIGPSDPTVPFVPEWSNELHFLSELGRHQGLKYSDIASFWLLIF